VRQNRYQSWVIDPLDDSLKVGVQDTHPGPSTRAVTLRWYVRKKETVSGIPPQKKLEEREEYTPPKGPKGGRGRGHPYRQGSTRTDRVFLGKERESQQRIDRNDWNAGRQHLPFKGRIWEASEPLRESRKVKGEV